MSIPIQLQNLPAAASPLDPTKFTHYNDGTTDFRATIAQMQAIIISALNAISVPQPTDLMIVQQGSTTGKVFFGQVGFTQGTRCWFYQVTAPMFWTSVGTGNTLLAVASIAPSPVVNYGVSGTPGTVSGTWQQSDVGGVAGQGLTINQMPLHAHGLNVRDDSGFNSNNYSRSAQASGANSKTLADDGSGAVQVRGTNSGTNGTSQAHNHGNVWRPLASVGIICEKQS